MTALAGRAGWMRSAACLTADPDLFVGPLDEGTAEKARREAQAKRVCAPCPVHAACLDYATRTASEHGVWGGQTEDERALLHRRHRRTELVEQAS